MSSFLTLGLAARTPSNSSSGLTARHGLLKNVPRVPGLAPSGGRDNDRERDWGQGEGQGYDDRYDNRDRDRYNDGERYEEREKDRK